MCPQMCLGRSPGQGVKSAVPQRLCGGFAGVALKIFLFFDIFP